MKRTAILIAALLALAAGSAHAAFPGRNGAIVYQRWSEDVTYDDDSGDVFTRSSSIEVRAPGGASRTLARCGPPIDCSALLLGGALMYGDPAVSPDGRQVVMRQDTGLALVDIGGGDLRPLPTVYGGREKPSFSPDGRRLVFEYSSDEMAPVLAITDLDGGQWQGLFIDGSRPSWSTRDWIAFEQGDGIWRMRPNRRGLRLLGAHGEQPTWSPRGTRLAFVGLHRPRRGLFVMDADGRHVHQIPFSGRIYDVAWSPDGRKLLVAADTARNGAALATIDLGSYATRYLRVRGVGDLDTFSSVDWQPLPRGHS